VKPRFARFTLHHQRMQFILRLVISAVALWITTLVVSGIDVTADSTVRDVGTFVVVALIFGLVNAVIKPLVRTFGCALYVLTLGLFALVVNALLFLLVGWLAEQLRLPFHIGGFWPAFWGAIVMAVVSWLLGLVLPDRFRRDSGDG
jgi:putative membrane protein